MKAPTVRVLIPLSLTLLCAAPGALAQSGRFARPMVQTRVDNAVRITRAGNVHPGVARGTDLGALSGDQTIDHVRLQLQRAPQDEAALEAYLASQQDPASPNYHQWGTADQFVEQFGVAESDIEAVEGWMRSQGLTVNFITPNMTIDFSGPVSAINRAFTTSLHSLSVNGVQHFANVTEPSVPAALAGVVLGPVALHDFKPHKLTSARQIPVTESGVHSDYTVNSSYHLVAPGDLATIYNFTPLYSSGISGQGQTVVLLERTDLYSNADFTSFRNAFGLAKAYPSGNLVVAHPSATGTAKTVGGVAIGPQTCKDPGDVVGDDGEATLDVEWASAAAPNATVELASCADSATNFGAFIALENLLTGTAPPTNMSLSYGSAESEEGASGNAYINALYELAVYEGVSLYVSTGDADADVADQGAKTATHGINVNALASTPYNVAVGGTDFADTYNSATAKYWSSTNSSTFVSALSYIPEIPWNDSCASQLLARYEGYSLTYGSTGFCNSSRGASFLNTAGGSGGPSACATGAAGTSGVVSGACKGYAKPSWQAGVWGVPADSVRDLPDVSMFAANGVWGHYYPYCYSNRSGGGGTCSGAPSTWTGAGGTSFGAPIWAAIQALIRQYSGAAQGNPDSTFYSLANKEFGPQGSTSCNSSNGSTSGSTCIFHDVTLGDDDAVCGPLSGVLYNCYKPSGTYGVMSTSNSAFAPSYDAVSGYDFATGLGTPNVYNLVHAFPAK